MAAFIGFFKKKWVVQLIGIVAVCALIWFFGPLVSIGESIPLESGMSRFVTLSVIVVLWGLNLLRVELAAKKNNEQMLADISGASEELSSASDEEIGILSKDFSEAMEVLKRSHSKGKGDKQYLYELPWYIIIGPPGSGKTTALINSGLEFPLSDSRGAEKIRGVGGTRNCDWWFTDDAVLLDTAGRYTTQDSHQTVDQAAWLGFLDLLKKHRPRRPINGVLVSMGVNDLLQQTEEERRLHARAIRQRIQELNDNLGIRFPVYMLFTKCDLVAGFTDFFGDLGAEERSQVWGETFAIDDREQQTDSIDLFMEHFKGLIERLNSRLLKRVQEERDIQRRNLIFGFPQQMMLLKDSIRHFLHEAFGASRYQKAVLLRGAYFTSGTQEGTPIDRLMGILASSFKLDRQSVPVYSGQGRSYFITRLLKEVVFQEAELTGVDQKLEQRRLWVQRGAYASAIGLCVGLVALWLTSFTRNQLAIEKQEEIIAEYRTAVNDMPDWGSDIKLLLPRLNAAANACDVFPEETPWFMGVGLYQGDKLRTAADRAYQRALKNFFLPTVITGLEQRIDQSRSADIDVLYQILRVYLMLGDPSKLESKLARPWISLEWEKIYANDPNAQAELMAHLEVLLSLDLDASSLNQNLVARIRRILTKVPVAQQVYSRIKSDTFGDHSLDFLAYKALGQYGDRVFTNSEGRLDQLMIPGLFTYKGFHDVFLKKSTSLAKEQVEQDWVLGSEQTPTLADIKRLQRELRSLYFKDFNDHWDGLLAKLRVKQFQTITQSLDLLEYASGPDSPLLGILKAVDKNTSLTRSSSGVLAALDKVKGKTGGLSDRVQKALGLAREEETKPMVIEKPGYEVERHFQDLNRRVRGEQPLINKNIASLNELLGFMTAIGSTSGGEAALKAASDRMKGGGSDVLARLRFESTRVPLPLKRWLQSMASKSWGVVLGGAKVELNNLWQTTVLPTYQTGLEGRYPLNRNSRTDITLEDFSHFFATNGVMDQFFNTHLRPFVDTTRRTWRAKEVDGQSIDISSSQLRQIHYASKIRDVFFRGGGQEPAIKFKLKPVYLDANVSKFTLLLDGQSNVYRHGPMVSRPFQWPGPDTAGRVSLIFESLNGKTSRQLEEGPWAWFRVLDHAKTEQTANANRLKVTFLVGSLKMRYELRAASVVNPFRLPELNQFRCPTRL